MGSRWVTAKPTAVFPQGYAAHAATIRQGILDIANKWAPIIAVALKERAPWQDITGNARAGLQTEVNQLTKDTVEIILAHGVDYGIFLELANQGRFAVIAPILDEYGPKIFADCAKLAQGISVTTRRG